MLTVVDVASRYKEAEPLTSKDSAEVAKPFMSMTQSFDAATDGPG